MKTTTKNLRPYEDLKVRVPALTLTYTIEIKKS